MNLLRSKESESFDIFWVVLVLSVAEYIKINKNVVGLLGDRESLTDFVQS